MIEKLSTSLPGLLHQFVEQTDSQVFLRMRHAEVAGSLRVGEDVMGALGALPANPPVQPTNQFGNLGIRLAPRCGHTAKCGSYLSHRDS